MTTQEQLTAALEGKAVERIAIDITPEGFLWTLYADGEAIFAGEAGPDQVASMLQATEVLIII